MAMWMPYFHGKNPVEFCIWCAMAHRQGFASMSTIQHVSTCLYWDESMPLKVSSMSMHITYMGKPVLLGDMDQDDHTTMIVHTIEHEYIRQSTWAHTHTTRLRALMIREGHSHSHESPSYKVHNHPYTNRYRYTYIMHNATTQWESKSDIANIANIPKVWPSKVQEM